MKSKLDLLPFVQKHPGFALTITYISLSLISFLANQNFYKYYGIDYSQFVEVNDLLFALLNIGHEGVFNFIIVIGIITSAAGIIVILEISRIRGFRVILLGIGIIIIGTGLFFIKTIHRDPIKRVEVTFIRPSEHGTDTLWYLGSSDKYHFLLKQENPDYNSRYFTSVVVLGSNVNSIRYIDEIERLSINDRFELEP